MAAGFCYLFCRSLGCSRTASLAGGLIFSLSGFLGNTPWPQMMNGAVWIPLVFLFQLRASRSRRPAVNAALSGMFLGIAFLSGHHQIPIFTTVAWIGVWIYLLARDRRLLVPAAVALLFAFLSGAMQTLPAYEYGRLAQRWVSAPEPITWSQPVPYSVHAHYDLKAFSLFGIVFPGVKAHFDPFLGVVALSLALLAVTALWRDSRVRLLAALAARRHPLRAGPQQRLSGRPLRPDPATRQGALAFLRDGALPVRMRGTRRLRDRSARHILDRPRHLDSRRIRHPHARHRPVRDLRQQTDVPRRRPRHPDRRHRAACRRPVRRLAASGSDLHPGACPAGSPAPLELGNSAQYNLADRSDRGQMQWLDQIHANADIADYLRKQPGFQRTEIAGGAFKANWGAFHGVEMHGGMGAGVTTNVVNSELFSLRGRRCTASPTPSPATRCPMPATRYSPAPAG